MEFYYNVIIMKICGWFNSIKFNLIMPIWTSSCHFKILSQHNCNNILWISVMNETKKEGTRWGREDHATQILEACGYKTPHTANRKKMTVATPTLQSYCKKVLSWGRHT